MIYEVTINNKKYEVEVENGQAAILETKEVAAPQAVSAPSAVAAPVTAPIVQPTLVNVNAAGGEVIKAPMPGNILDIKVSIGSRVKKGDVLFILEAMKMENEIVAPKDGTVAKIQTVKGSTVNTGDLLAVMQQ
jgi:biotin carboxyl carrier protein